MKDYVIVTDSSCDLPRELVDAWGVRTLSLEVTVDGVGSFLNHEIDPKEFYSYMRGKHTAKTSAANMDGFAELFEEIIKEGKDVLYIGFSSGLSATFMAGKNAAEETVEKYPESKIVVVDSLCASLGQGLFVHYAVTMKEQGKSLEEVAAWLEENKFHLCHQFTVDDLFHLHRGGRVSKATAIVGSTLGIKPVMHVDNEGKLIKVEVARGRKASLKKLVDHMKDTYTELDKVYICHGDCEEEATALGDSIKQQFEVGEMIIHHIGPVIASHSGPGTMAVFFIGKER